LALLLLLLRLVINCPILRLPRTRNVDPPALRRPERARTCVIESDHRPEQQMDLRANCTSRVQAGEATRGSREGKASHDANERSIRTIKGRSKDRKARSRIGIAGGKLEKAAIRASRDDRGWVVRKDSGKWKVTPTATRTHPTLPHARKPLAAERPTDVPRAACFRSGGKFPLAAQSTRAPACPVLARLPRREDE